MSEGIFLQFETHIMPLRPRCLVKISVLNHDVQNFDPQIINSRNMTRIVHAQTGMCLQDMRSRVCFFKVDPWASLCENVSSGINGQ